MKQIKRIGKALLIIHVLYFTQAHAQDFINQTIVKATTDFEQGRYNSTVKLLQKITPKKNRPKGAKAYLLGVAHNKLQEYDLAAKNLKKAHSLNHSARDLYYEWGQALYANNQLELARKNFNKSYNIPYKTSESLYYMGHISRLLLEHKKAISYYKTLIKNDKEDSSLRQVGRFQMAESILALSEKLNEDQQQRIVDQTVLPLLRLALKTDPHGQALKDIESRLRELQDKFGLDPNKMVNGRRISPKRWKVYAAQRLKFDDNVTLANDQPTITITQQDSYISESVLDFSHEDIFKREFSLEYGLRIQNIIHHDRSSPDVYSNDRYVLTPQLDGSWEHRINGKMAVTKLSLSYDYTGQDIDGNKEKSFFSRSFNLGLTERVRLLPFGDTSFKIKFKRYRNKKEAQHFNSMSLGVDQVAILPNGDLLVALLNYTDVDNFNNTKASTANLILRADYIMTEVISKTDITYSFTYSALDTKEQSETRGTEKTLSPSIRVSRKVSDSLRLSLEHSFSHKSSLSQANEYDKNVTTFELRYLY